MSTRSSTVTLAALLLLCACSGPPKTAGQSGPSAEAEPDDTRRSAITRHETFDASAYVARPPKQAMEVDHRVPDRLMRGRAYEGVKRRMQGFRVQVFSAVDKKAAQNFRQEVRQWWTNNKERAPQDVFGEDPPIVIMYSQPYYRVRIGAFVERDSAEDAVQFLRSEYPKAFVARSTVTVTR